MIVRNLLLALTLSILTGCSGTTVVLVPDSEGKVGKVSMKTEGGSQTLTKANESTEVSKPDQAPSKPEVLSEKEVRSMFSDVLAKEPDAPKRFNELLFDMGATDISPKDKAYLDKIYDTIQARKSCDISVIGHSDRVGDNKSNEGISRKRAENVKKVLIDMGVQGNCIDPIRYYGENDPAYWTPDNVPEPRNRRVEVEIR
jgi:outer membrane protein OmpA-like peptidoglycan-associated protein